MAIKEHIQRIVLTARKIQSKPYISLDDLGREIEREMVARDLEPATSPNTIKRDIQEIRENFFIDIKYCRTNRGYYIEKEDNADIETLLEPFDMLYALNIDGGLPEFVYPEPCRPKGTKHLFTLIEAIRKHRKINFTYFKYSTSATTNRTIEPYALKESRGRWYIIGKENSGVIKTFGLDRIENLAVLGAKFTLDPTFNINKKFQYSYGIYSDETYPIEDIILAFDAEDGGYLKSVPLHASQEIIKDTADEFIIKLRIRLTPDFLMEIISRSWSLRVISPNSLRERVCSIYAEAYTRNKY